MALIGQRNNPQNEASPKTTFHEAIQQFIQPPNPNEKSTLPTFRKRSKKCDPRLSKPAFDLSKESAQPIVDDLSPRRFDGSSTTMQFKSPAVFCEVRLAEMLSKAKPRERPDKLGKYYDAPDAYRTSVYCQLMMDVCKLAAPFTNVLCKIHDELEIAIYSNYVTPSSTTIFEQIPYFELVNNLEKKNSDILKEQQELKVLLSQTQVDLDAANVHIEELKQQVTKEQELVVDLKYNLASSTRVVEKSNKEVARLQDQIAKNRLEVLKAREMEQSLEEVEARYENLMAKHINIVHELQHYQQNLEVARREAAEGVPKKEIVAAKAHIKELQHKLIKAEVITKQVGTMTPRPHWALLRGGAYYTMSTASQAAEICKLNDLLLENVTSLRVECAIAQVALAEITPCSYRMVGTRIASFYTCPQLRNPRVVATTLHGEIFHIGEVDTVKLFFGEHHRPCYGGANCDSNWRKENTCKLEEMLSLHHVACGGNPMEEFLLNAPLIDNQVLFDQGMRILMQKERDWMNIHPNAEPYPHTIPKMYDTREEQEWMARHPNAFPRLGV